MVKQLHTIIKESSKQCRSIQFCVLAWFDDQPLWATNTMTVLGDPQIQAYLGEYQLRHSKEYLSSLGGEYKIGQHALGCYPLEVQGTRLHLAAPQKPQSWDGFRNINFSFISELVENAEQGLEVVCKGVSRQKKVKEEVYLFTSEKKDTSRITQDQIYLPKDQVDYVKNLHPLKELYITVQGVGIYFKRENFLAVISMLNPGLI